MKKKTLLTSAVVLTQLTGEAVIAREGEDYEADTSRSVIRRKVSPGQEKQEGALATERPAHFLSQFGLDLEDIAREEAEHRALEKGENFKQEAEKLLAGNAAITAEIVSKLKALAMQNFGDDVEVEMIPYGLRFAEKLPKTLPDWTATASGTVNSAGQGDVDADG